MILSRAEVEDGHFYEHWRAVGCTFFIYISVFESMQRHMRERRAVMRDVDPAGYDYFTTTKLTPETPEFTLAKETLHLISAFSRLISAWKALKPASRTKLQCKKMVTAAIHELTLPEELKQAVAVAWTKDLNTEYYTLMPVGDGFDEVFYFLRYQGTQGFSSSVDRKKARDALRSLFFSKNRTRTIGKQFDLFVQAFEQMKEQGLGALPPMEFWQGKGAVNFPLLREVALSLLTIPQGSHVVRMINITNAYMVKQFRHLVDMKKDPLLYTQVAVNFHRVDASEFSNLQF